MISLISGGRSKKLKEPAIYTLVILSASLQLLRLVAHKLWVTRTDNY